MKVPNLKRLLWLSVAINVLLITGFTVKKIINHQHIKEEIGFRDLWNMNRITVFDWLGVDSSDIVFIGDSNTEGFPLNEIYPGRKIKNRGVSSNTTIHILGRLKSIIDKHPRKIFLQAGINDIYSDEPYDSLLSRYQKIVGMIRSAGITPYCQSLLPLAYRYTYMKKDADRFNDWLKQYCEKNNITYIDICSPLEKDGELDPACTIDGLHVNAEGYKRWAAAIDKYLD
jgi:lysophospholipase L1-like esterase